MYFIEKIEIICLVSFLFLHLLIPLVFCILWKKSEKVSLVSFYFSAVKHRGNYLAFYRESRDIFVSFFSFPFSSFTYSAHFLYFMKEIEKTSLVYFSFSPRLVISIIFHQRYPWRRCRCRGQLFFFTVAPTVEFLESFRLFLSKQLLMIEILRSFLLYQHVHFI